MILEHPITGEEVHAEVAEWLPGCAYFRCTRTGLQWLDPIPGAGPLFPDFSCDAEKILSIATPKILDAEMPPFERASFNWVRHHFPPGAKIVELFAETGRLSWRLKAAGYNVRLADPLPAHISVFHKYGLEAVQALDPFELPSEYFDADAVIILESIVRLTDPGNFIRRLRSCFGRAHVFLTAPSMRRSLKTPGVDRRTGYPPDFLTRWTIPALRQLLATAGYISRGRSISPGLLSSLRNRNWAGRAYLLSIVLLMLVEREYEFSICAWGRPTLTRS